MLNTPMSRRGMVTAPHHLASQAGLDILRAGGNAVEAAVAMAAMVAVVYPHMTGIGGDGFWLIAEPGRPPVAVSAAGSAGAAVTPGLYRRQGLDAVPWRGPLAANTVAGAVASWRAALEIAQGWGSRLPLARLLADAIAYAEDGIAVTADQAATTAAKLAELGGQPGFAETYLPGGAVPEAGARQCFPALGRTLRRLAEDGLDSFYRGPLAATIAADLARAGSPLAAADLAGYRAQVSAPLSVRLGGATLYNSPPPTQGVSSLMILALFERLKVDTAEGFAHIHGLVEATKQAFRLRDRHLGDPATMTANAADWLDAAALDPLAAAINPRRASPWPAAPASGDTVWLGVIDGAGRAVSFIQSIYFEFGSGVVLRDSGITWQNRGSAFRLDGAGPRALAPGRRPFHTLNPALARFDDGRTMVYGTMGGEGQPQTQAALFSRYALFGQPLQAAVTAPRWLLGRTWGDAAMNLKLEGRFPESLLTALRAAGHVIERVGDFDPMMGHAGAIVHRPDPEGPGATWFGATDPRSDGAAAGW